MLCFNILNIHQHRSGALRKKTVHSIHNNLVDMIEQTMFIHLNET